MLPLCNTTNIFNGSWIFESSLPVNYNPWHHCQSFGHSFSNMQYVRLNHYNNSYSCKGNPYLKATYQPNECQVLSFDESLRRISGDETLKQSKSTVRKKQLIYIGDSMSTQQFVTGACSIEAYIDDRSSKRHHKSKRKDKSITKLFSAHPYDTVHGFPLINYDTTMINTTLISEVFFRRDIPCQQDCVTNSTFLHMKHDFFSPCWACSDGNQMDLTTYDTDLFWPSLIQTKDTLAIVTGCGAWYNAFHTFKHSVVEYTKTLKLIGPIFQRFKRDYDIDTYWVSLPSHGFTEKEKAVFYEWINFPEKNIIAKQILQSFGVIYVDIESFTESRKLLDPKISSDGLHWCSPGQYSLPATVNQLVYHLIATKLPS